MQLLFIRSRFKSGAAYVMHYFFNCGHISAARSSFHRDFNAYFNWKRFNWPPAPSSLQLFLIHYSICCLLRSHLLLLLLLPPLLLPLFFFLVSVDFFFVVCLFVFAAMKLDLFGHLESLVLKILERESRTRTCSGITFSHAVVAAVVVAVVSKTLRILILLGRVKTGGREDPAETWSRQRYHRR